MTVTNSEYKYIMTASMGQVVIGAFNTGREAMKLLEEFQLTPEDVWLHLNNPRDPDLEDTLAQMYYSF